MADAEVVLPSQEFVVGALRERAESYARDAEKLRHEGNADDEALIYEAIRDELRKVADDLEESA